MAKAGENVVGLGPEYGYQSKSTGEGQSLDSDEMVTLEELPVARIDDWLSPSAEKVIKWIKLPSRNAKILIKAMTNDEFKKIRSDAPVIKTKNKSGGLKLEKDEDWIQNQLIIENVMEPKIPNHDALQYGLAGDITFLTMEISKLSGFDVEKAIRDALE